MSIQRSVSARGYINVEKPNVERIRRFAFSTLISMTIIISVSLGFGQPLTQLTTAALSLTRWNHMVASMRALVLTPFENNCLKGIFFI